LLVDLGLIKLSCSIGISMFFIFSHLIRIILEINKGTNLTLVNFRDQSIIFLTIILSYLLIIRFN
jgi:hypothetical protein